MAAEPEQPVAAAEPMIVMEDEPAPAIAYERQVEAGGFIPSVFFDGDPGSPCASGNQLRGSGEENGYTCMELFFGTNRELAQPAPSPLDAYDQYPSNPDDFFVDRRGPYLPPAESFLRVSLDDEGYAIYETYATGRAFVTVPKRQPGDKVKPFSYKGFFGGERLPTEEDRQEAFTFFRYELLDQEDFWSEARGMRDVSLSAAGFEDFADWRNDAGAVLVYVHGFNSSLSGAAYRTAQLAYDLEFAGVPLFFSWPANSSGNVLSYFNDMSEGSASVGDLKMFLRDVENRLAPTKYILVAHSHGNQILLDALNEMAAEEEAGAPQIFDAIIFASPDVDAVEFKRLAERAGDLAATKILYTSKNDRANWFRTALTGLRIPFFGEELETKPRAGYIPPDGEPLVVEGVTTIDVSNACVGPYGSDLEAADSSDRLKHSKYADASDLITDMRALLDSIAQPPIAQPHLRNHAMLAIPQVQDPQYWRFDRPGNNAANCG